MLAARDLQHIRSFHSSTQEQHLTLRCVKTSSSSSKSSSSSSDGFSCSSPAIAARKEQLWRAGCRRTCQAGGQRSTKRSMAAASASAADGPSAAAAEADLSAIKQAGDLERLLFAQSMQAGGGAPPKPNAPVTPAEFVEALEMIVRSSGNPVNPEQLDEILAEILSLQLLDHFSTDQLTTCVKNLAIMCASLNGDFLEAVLGAIETRMAQLDIKQLASIAWGLMRLMPVTDEEVREELGMRQQWMDSYLAAAEQQLQQVVVAASASASTAAAAGAAGQGQASSQQQQDQQQQQQVVVPALPKLPSAQQVANLLLLPAAAMQPLQPSLLAVLEEVLLLRQHSFCGFAVAQLLTCYVRLGSLQPGAALLSALLEHLQEELALYDYDELTQVAFNAYVLQLQLPNTLLADITQRADALEEAGLAAEGDSEVLREALQRLAAQKVMAAAAGGAGGGGGD